MPGGARVHPERTATYRERLMRALCGDLEHIQGDLVTVGFERSGFGAPYGGAFEPVTAGQEVAGDGRSLAGFRILFGILKHAVLLCASFQEHSRARWR